MRFRELHSKLVDIARQKIRSGQFTERGLAALSDISQPHLHNVLKNIRTLSPEMADRLLHALGIGVPELLWHEHGDPFHGFRAVPVITSRIGAGSDPAFNVFRGYLPFPANLIDPLVDPIAVRLAPDLVMPKPFAADDLVLLDQNPEMRREPAGQSAWIVQDLGGLRVRYVRMSGMRLYVANELTMASPGDWNAIPLSGRNILDIVRARIVWIGREMEAPAPRPLEQAG